jgi:hypothetical protein
VSFFGATAELRGEPIDSVAKFMQDSPVKVLARGSPAGAVAARPHSQPRVVLRSGRPAQLAAALSAGPPGRRVTARGSRSRRTRPTCRRRRAWAGRSGAAPRQGACWLAPAACALPIGARGTRQVSADALDGFAAAQGLSPSPTRLGTVSHASSRPTVVSSPEEKAYGNEHGNRLNRNNYDNVMDGKMKYAGRDAEDHFNEGAGVRPARAVPPRCPAAAPPPHRCDTCRGVLPWPCPLFWGPTALRRPCAASPSRRAPSPLAERPLTARSPPAHRSPW